MNGPVVIMAGGTGGHVFPGLAVADELRAREVPVVWLGGLNGIERTVVPAQGIELHALAFGGVRGKGILTLAAAPFRLLRAVMAARRLLRALAPRSVISFGGYAAAPGGIAAWLLRIPLLVHEANRIPGTANRLLARLARHVLCGFPDTFAPRAQVEVTGNPVRAAIGAIDPPSARLRGRAGPLRLLVLGGSQGARSLNAGVPVAINESGPARWQVRHQCGRGNSAQVSEAYASVGVRANVSDFIDDMAEAYGWADLAVCRAGASTLAEIAAAGVASVLVPFPHAIDDHQTANARWLADAQAADLVRDGAGLAERLGHVLRMRCDDREALVATANRARALARPGATARIAELCLGCAA